MDPHEIIKEKQIQSCKRISNKLPTKVKKSLWIYAKCDLPQGKGLGCQYPPSTVKSGKWVLFVDCKNVDQVWTFIGQMTREGKLGDCSKVVSKGLKKMRKHSSYAICVYTYDSTDIKDKGRIYENIQQAVGQKLISIHYKTNEKTMSQITR